MTAPRSHRVELDTGLGYHVLEWGGEDPSLDHTVVLVHGFLDQAWGWAPMVEAGLAGRFHVVAPDMRGHGDSDRVGAGGYYHFFDYLADMHSLVRQLGRERVSLVGHSMGGSVASYYAGSYPARIHKLALLEGTGPPEMADAGPQTVVTWLASWQRVRERAQNSYDSVAEAAERIRKSDPRLSEQMVTMLAERGTAVGEDGRWQFKHDPLHLTRGPYPFKVANAERFWRAITCPVLLVEGGESVFRHGAEEKARRHACFANHRFEVIEGAAHMMQRHQPRALAALLAEFLAE